MPSTGPLIGRPSRVGRGEHEQPHAGELLGESGGVESPIGGGDVAQVRSGGLEAAVEDRLQLVQVVGTFVHVRLLRSTV